MTSDLILHRGAREVSKYDLEQIPLPEETDTYKPVGHYQLVDTIATIGRDILRQELIREQYGVGRNGNQLFAVLSFGNGNDKQALSIGIRNSLDRSMSAGLAIGVKLFICDNLAFSADGGIAVLKKHTKGIWEALENLAISTLYKSGKVYENILVDFDRMRGVRLNDDEAYKTFGLLYGREILSPRQLTTAVDYWKKTPLIEFQERNLYSAYNCCTEALKSSAPLTAMDKYIDLHKTVEGVYAV